MATPAATAPRGPDQENCKADTGQGYVQVSENIIINLKGLTDQMIGGQRYALGPALAITPHIVFYLLALTETK